MGKAHSQQRLVRHLHEDATCLNCGETAANAACGRKLDEFDATERNFVEVWSKWNGNTLKNGTEPDECFPLDEAGIEWEVCGDCGCARWEMPNEKAEPSVRSKNL